MRERKRREGKGAEEGRREEIFKKLVHMIVGAVKFEIHKAGWRRRNPGRSSCCSCAPEAEFLPTQGTCVLCAKSLQSCPTLCKPMDCNLPGSSVHGILQAWILEWVAMPFSRGSSQPRDWTHISWASCFGSRVLYHWHHLGSLGL